MEAQQQQPRRSAWMFWLGLGITIAITLGLIGVLTWLVVTQNLTQLSVIAGLIASIVVIVSTPLVFYVTVVKKPEKHEPGSSLQTKEPEPPQTSISTIWNIPYRRNPYFTGREEVLHILHEHLNAAKSTALTQSQAISGLGGVGKTQIAVEYAYRHQEEYYGVLWVNAASRETIIASFLELANLLELPERQEADQHKIITAMRHWLTAHDHWLLIFDNADDLTLAEEFLPTSTTGSLLFTTRNQSVGTLAESLDIQTMTQEEGTLLVLRRAKLLAREKGLDQSKPEELAQTERVVKEMEGLPLALDQAAAYIEETHCTLPAFLEKYQRQREDILRRRGGTGKEHPLPVATTWSLSFVQIEQLNPAAADLLRVCAFLAPDAIPEEMIVAGATELGTQLAPLQKDATRLDEVIGALNRFSLVRRDREEHTLSLHRLVQDVQLMAMDEPIRKIWTERVIRAVNQAFPQVEVVTWLQCERYLPHALACAYLIETQKIETAESAQLLNQIGYYLSERGQYAEVEPHYRRALAIRESVLGDNNPDTASSLNNLALFYRRQGKYSEAEQLFTRALAVREQVLGPNHPDTATSLDTLAFLYCNLRKDKKAEPLFTRALAIREQVLGPSHPDTASSLNNLAFLYRRQHKYKQAEQLLLRALAIREQVLGPNHPDTSYSLNNLALLYLHQGKYEQAEPLYQRALANDEQVSGPNHPYTAAGLNNLALLYLYQGKYEQAEPLFTRAITIREQVLGPNHPYTAASLSNLADLLRNQGKDSEAEPLYQRALAIREQALGPNHLNTAQSLNNLALLYQNQGKDGEAEPLYQRALAIMEKRLGPHHPTTKTVRDNYARLLEEMKRKKR
jgi:tetratricopeptide (TPR) repeat protein